GHVDQRRGARARPPQCRALLRRHERDPRARPPRVHRRPPAASELREPVGPRDLLRDEAARPGRPRRRRPPLAAADVDAVLRLLTSRSEVQKREFIVNYNKYSSDLLILM